MAISDRTAAFAGALAGMWLATAAVGLLTPAPDDDDVDPPATPPPRVVWPGRAWIVELDPNEPTRTNADTRNADTRNADTRNADRVSQALEASEWP